MEIKTEVVQLAEENWKKRLGRKGASQTLPGGIKRSTCNIWLSNAVQTGGRMQDAMSWSSVQRLAVKAGGQRAAEASWGCRGKRKMLRAAQK